MTIRNDRIDALREMYDLAPPQSKASGEWLERIARALADAKRVGATTRECMDAMRGRDWGRYKKYRDYAHEKGWLE